MKSPGEVIEGLTKGPSPARGPGHEAQRLNHAFKDYSDLADRMVILEYCETRDKCTFFATAGEMCLSMVFNEPGREGTNPEMWLDRAEQNWRTAIQRTNQRDSDVFCQAALRLASSDSYLARVDGLILPTSQRELSYRGVVRAAATQIDALKQNPQVFNGGLAGSMAELSVWSILERFSLRNSDNCWAASPSLPYEDMGTPGVGKKLSWDTSVFTQYDYAVAPDLTYKVQTKAGYRRNGYGYDDDIAVISLSRHLVLKDDSDPERLPFHQVAQECYDELFSANPTRAKIAAQRLNLREGVLLDLLDTRTKVSPKNKQDAALAS